MHLFVFVTPGTSAAKRRHREVWGPGPGPLLWCHVAAEAAEVGVRGARMGYPPHLGCGIAIQSPVWACRGPPVAAGFVIPSGLGGPPPPGGGPGSGPMGPCPLGPWAHAHWARARAHGPWPIGPMGPGPLGGGQNENHKIKLVLLNIG